MSELMQQFRDAISSPAQAWQTLQQPHLMREIILVVRAVEKRMQELTSGKSAELSSVTGPPVDL